MLVKETPAKPGGKRFPLAEQARALAIVLREEFGVPFAFYDLAAGEPVGDAGGEGLEQLFDPELLAALTADGRASVSPQPGGRYRLALLLYEAGKPVLAAAGELAGLAREGCDGREQARLQKWLQAVCDRLRLADQLLARRRAEEESSAQGLAAWEALLALDHLVRRLRIHKEPTRNQHRVLEAAHGLLGVQSLVWVPLQPDEPVLTHGEFLLAPADCRTLVAALAQCPDFRPPEPLLLNDFAAGPWGARFPQVGNLLAFLVTDQGPLGWVLAVNKKARQADKEGPSVPVSAAPSVASSAFRRSDAVLLTPFVALFELHARGSGRYQDLKELLVGLTRSLTAALDAKDSYTYGHSERVARIAVELGRELGLPADELSDIYLAGLLHDVGKIGIRDAVLSKVEPLTPEEFEHIKQHVTIGYAILSDLRPIRNLLPGVLYHHEHFDGRGYPDGLAGEAIPLLARILAVADAYDAMSTTRPYRDAMPCRKVEEVLLSGKGKQWDGRIIDAFMRCRHRVHTIRQRGVGDSLQMAIDGALRIDQSSATRKSDVIPRHPPACPE